MMDRGAVGMLEKVVLEISLDGGIGEYVCRRCVDGENYQYKEVFL